MKPEEPKSCSMHSSLCHSCKFRDGEQAWEYEAQSVWHGAWEVALGNEAGSRMKPGNEVSCEVKPGSEASCGMRLAETHSTKFLAIVGCVFANRFPQYRYILDMTIG